MGPFSDLGIWHLGPLGWEARKRFSVEQIINHLWESDVLLAQGRTVGEVFRRIGVSEQSYYRWRKEYGGLKVGQARRLKDLEGRRRPRQFILQKSPRLYVFSPYARRIVSLAPGSARQCRLSGETPGERED